MVIPEWVPRVALSPDTVTVVLAPLEVPAAWMPALQDALGEADRAALVRAKHPEKRRELLVGRGLLRLLLGQVLRQTPESLVFTHGAHGKPSLADPTYGIEFNVSHTRGALAIALAMGRAVGVDIEWPRPDTEIEPLAERFFSPAEFAGLQALPGAERRRAFFAIWTRKEAFLKALGTGISAGLDTFDVTVDPDAPPRVLRTAWDPAEAARWQLVMLHASGGLLGCVAARGHGWSVHATSLLP